MVSVLGRCLLLLTKKMVNRMAITPSTPPTTPPAIAPESELLVGGDGVEANADGPINGAGAGAGRPRAAQASARAAMSGCQQICVHINPHIMYVTCTQQLATHAYTKSASDAIFRIMIIQCINLAKWEMSPWWHLYSQADNCLLSPKSADAHIARHNVQLTLNAIDQWHSCPQSMGATAIP